MDSESFVVENLSVAIGGKEILHSVSFSLRPGEVVAIMGPNGSGKSTLSHALMGREGYRVTGGSITLNGQSIGELPTHLRAQRGLSLVSQYPGEVPGVSAKDLLESAFQAQGKKVSDAEHLMNEATQRVGLDVALLDRWVNVDLSGGEKKRFETMLLSVLSGTYAVIDEIDSGLDIDALRAVAHEIRRLVTQRSLGVLAITHYARLLVELKPSRVLVLVKGEIVDEGGPELAEALEKSGYAEYVGPEAAPAETFESLFGL